LKVLTFKKCFHAGGDDTQRAGWKGSFDSAFCRLERSTKASSRKEDRGLVSYAVAAACIMGGGGRLTEYDSHWFPGQGK